MCIVLNICVLHLPDTSPHFTPDEQHSSTVPFQCSLSQPTPEIPIPSVHGHAQGWLHKNRGFVENVKQLQGNVVKFQDSEATKTAKDECARVCPCPPIRYSKPDSIGLSLQLASSIEENPKLRAAAEELRKPVSRSEMPCQGLLNLWKSPRLCVLSVLLNDFRRSRHHSHITCA